jgi:hypothetical protein
LSEFVRQRKTRFWVKYMIAGKFPSGSGKPLIPLGL